MFSSIVLTDWILLYSPCSLIFSFLTSHLLVIVIRREKHIGTNYASSSTKFYKAMPQPIRLKPLRLATTFNSFFLLAFFLYLILFSEKNAITMIMSGSTTLDAWIITKCIKPCLVYNNSTTKNSHKSVTITIPVLFSVVVSFQSKLFRKRVIFMNPSTINTWSLQQLLREWQVQIPTLFFCTILHKKYSFFWHTALHYYHCLFYKKMFIKTITYKL